MNLSFSSGSIFISANDKKVECAKEQLLVNTAFEMLMNHNLLNLEDAGCGADDEYDFYKTAMYDLGDAEERDMVKELWPSIKKAARKVVTAKFK